MSENHTTCLILYYKEQKEQVGQKKWHPPGMTVMRKREKRSCYQQVEPLPHCVHTIPEFVA
jgi:hypothetical protein